MRVAFAARASPIARVMRPTVTHVRALRTTTPMRNPFVARFALYLLGRGIKRVREALPQRIQWVRTRLLALLLL